MLFKFKKRPNISGIRVALTCISFSLSLSLSLSKTQTLIFPFCKPVYPGVPLKLPPLITEAWQHQSRSQCDATAAAINSTNLGPPYLQ